MVRSAFEMDQNRSSCDMLPIGVMLKNFLEGFEDHRRSQESLEGDPYRRREAVWRSLGTA